MGCASRRPESGELVLKTRLPARRPGQSAYQEDYKSESRLRLFFALWPPVEVAQALHAWALAAQSLTGGRVTRLETIHLTLAFLGDVPGPRVAALIECARRVRGRPFELVLDHARRWQKNGIVWAGPCETPEGLRDLAAQLAAALGEGGFRTEAREFKAHVSLVRRSEHERALPAFAPLAWRAEEFVLVRSTLSAAGPAYATLARLSLGEAG